MRKAIFLTFVFCLAAIAVQAQKPGDFSGKWTLDVAKSKLGDRNSIESQTMTVTQTAADIKVETATKRTAPPAGAPAGGPGGGGGGGRGFGGGDMPMTYTLDGKEVKSEMQGQGGSMAITTKSKLDGNKFSITRSIATPNGDRTTTDNWELSADGKTLTVTSTRPNRDGGTDTTTKVFTKG